MDTTELQGVKTPLDIAAMNPSEFVQDTERKWNFAERLVALVNEGVRDESVTPIEAASLTSCITAEIFNHSAYHSGGILGVSASELLTYAHRLFGGGIPTNR